MRVFITGATGFVGSAIVKELLNTGHQVVGLSRSDDSAKKLNAVGAAIHPGSLHDLGSLQKGAASADAVIHCAYENDFSKIDEISKQESKAIEALGSALKGSDRPFLITSVAAMGISAPGQPALESHFDPNTLNPRKATEIAASAVADSGVNVSIVRLSQVHDTKRQGLVSGLIRSAQANKIAAYVGDVQIRWAAVHLLDVARLYRFVLEINQPGRYHAVAEEGVSLRHITEAIAHRLQLPSPVSLSKQKQDAYFGPLSIFADLDMSASNDFTRQILGWQPEGPGLIQDIQDAII